MTLMLAACSLQGGASETAAVLRIEQLIDIKHPANPTWSHSGHRVAFVCDPSPERSVTSRAE
jgi:hypothetical protein